MAKQSDPAIALLLPNATVLTGTEATEATLKQLQAPSILHLATHGFFLQDVEFVPPADVRGTGTIISVPPGESSVRSSQMMSLWKVDDYGTSELMSLYYERLSRGENRSEALRQVQLEFLEAPAYRHPFYWAAFIFSGDWSSMAAL